MADGAEQIKYSVAVPLYNEEANILPLYEALRETLEPLGAPFECVFVDDGSSDGSGVLLQDLAREDSRIVVVTLPWNSGKSAALRAAFDVASGVYIVTMDGDLQHDPSDIPRFLEKLEAGNDIVCGRRLRHTEISWPQQLANRAANWALAKLSGVPISDFGSGFKAYRRELIVQLPLYGELQRLIPIMALRKGRRICEIPIVVAPRTSGVSKYGWSQKLPFFFDLITVRFLTTYMSRPMHFFGTAGIGASLAGIGIALWLMIETLLQHTVVFQEHGPMMFFSTVLILAGIQLFAVGLLAEMQVRHYHDRLSGHPPYTVTRSRPATEKTANLGRVVIPAFLIRSRSRDDQSLTTMTPVEEFARPHPHTIAAPPRSFPYVLGILFFWAVIYLPGLAWPPMMDDADSEHAVIAREMLQRHDFVTMHVNGVRYLDKAPLPYWITALGYKVLGVSEFSARLPITIFALFAFLAVYALGREINGEKTGFFSALILTTTIGPYIYTRFTIPDIMVCFWITVTVLLFLRTLKQTEPSRWLCWSIAIATSLDVLTKGLIGLVFPILIIGTYLLVTGNLRHLLRMRLLSSTVVFLAVAAPWHVLITLRNPAAGESKGFFWFYFINEQLYRYLNKRIPHDYDKVPLLIFWGLILVWLVPWSFFVLASLKQVPLRKPLWRNVLGEQDRAALLMAVWALAVLVFFSFSSRQEYYVLPALPALAVLCGMWLAKEAHSPPGSSERRVGIRCSLWLFGLGLAGFLVGGYFAATAPTPPSGTDIAALLESAPTYKLSMGHLFDLTGRAMGLFRWPLGVTAVGLFAGTFANWRFRRSGSPDRGNLALAGMMVVLFYAIHLSLGIFNPVIGSKTLAVAIGEQFVPGDTVVVDGPQSRASSVLFYTGIPLHMLNSRIGSDLWYGSLFPDSPAVFEDDASFARLWLGPKRVFFFMPKKTGIAKLQALGRPYYLVASAGGKSVYTNEPMAAQ